MNPAALFVPHLRRLRARIGTVFADLPIVFFAVVIGVALTFRVAIGWAKGGATPEPPAPVATAHEPPPSVSAPRAPQQAAPIAMAADPQATALPTVATSTPASKPFARPARSKARKPH